MTGVQTCALDRKSTRLNSSHTIISYAVFCLKKKKTGKGPRDVGHQTGGEVKDKCFRSALRRSQKPSAFARGNSRRFCSPSGCCFFLKKGPPPESPPFPLPPPFRI